MVLQTCLLESNLNKHGEISQFEMELLDLQEDQSFLMLHKTITLLNIWKMVPKVKYHICTLDPIFGYLIRIQIYTVKVQKLFFSNSNNVYIKNQLIFYKFYFKFRRKKSIKEKN